MCKVEPEFDSSIIRKKEKREIGRESEGDRKEVRKEERKKGKNKSVSPVSVTDVALVQLD